MLATGVLLLGGADDLNEARLKCEEAVKHLADCCPGLDPAQFQCGDACNQPRFAESASECLLGKSCADASTGSSS